MAAATLHVLVELETMDGGGVDGDGDGWDDDLDDHAIEGVRSSKEGEGVRVGDDGDVDAYNTVRDVQHSAITTPLRRERCHAQHHDGTGIAATIAARSPTHLTCLRGAVASLSSSGSCYFFSEFSCESSCYALSIHEGAP